MGLSEEELKLIGGSDASAIAGLNPYRSPHDVFARVVGGRVEPETKPMRRGNLMEPVIRSMAEDEYGMKFLGPRKLRLRGFMRASLDDVLSVDGGEEVAEFKSVNPFAAAQYGEEGTDEVPRHHICQVQFYMGATGLPRAHLVALIGVDDLRHYVIRADADLQGMLFEEVERFHRDHVLTGKPPPVDSSPACAQWLAERFPKNDGGMVKADLRATLIASRLQHARHSKAEAEAIEREARNQLVELIGEADGIEGDGWRITHKFTKGKTKTDWEALARELGATDAFIQRHTVIAPGFRTFRPTFRGGSDE